MGNCGLLRAVSDIRKNYTLFLIEKLSSLASKIKHNNPRIGIVNIDTIQVNFDFSLFGLWGHTYFAQEDVVLNDIHSLLNENREPSKRSYPYPSC